MAFDEQLRHTFDTLAARLHEEIAGQLGAAVVDLSASMNADRARVAADAAGEAWTAAERELSDRLTANLAAAAARARTDVEAGAIAANERLLDGVRAIDRGESLSDILDLLVATAGTEAARAAIFLPEGSRWRGCRTIGFEGLEKNGPAIALSLEMAGIVADAAETSRVARAGDPAWSGSSRAASPAFAELPPDRPALAVPLVMSGQVCAVLYADQGASGNIARESWPASIEVLARHAARSLEAITAVRLAQVSKNGTSSDD